jgi:hypothetical protein
MNNFPLLFQFPDLISSLTICSHSTIRITFCDTLYRHYFKWQRSVDPSSLSMYYFISPSRPNAPMCSAVEAGSDKYCLSDKITTLYIRTHSAADWLQTHTKLSGDSTPRFNTSVNPSHFSPLYFLRINVKTCFLLFLRPATSCFLSFLTTVSHLLNFRNSQRCFWGFIASWMRVSVD